MASFDQFINSVVADGNDGKAFECFCKHFLETSPEYKDQFEKVWLWDDWPEKWSQDKGIDLIAKYKGRDKYCAIQSKCYAAHNTVPYDEVTNFLADSNRVEIEDRILMMSTNKLNEKTSKEVIQGQEKQVVIRDRHYFESLNYDYPAHISELSKAKLKERATPRSHQKIAIDEVEKGLSENDRGQLIMACGTGKTFTTLWIKERLKAKTVLVLLPSLSLLSQTMREWVWGASEPFEALAVCSDPTVGKSKNIDEDISTAEVGKVTWQVEEIQSFLKQKKLKVIFCTYQSSELIQEAQKDKTIEPFDLVVCDEAHRCAGKANAGFATILDDEKISAHKRLFTTATPRYFSKSVLKSAKVRGFEILGMDDERSFGPVVHKLTFGEAINYSPEPLLTDYQVVVVGVDEPMVRNWIANGEIVSTCQDYITDARTLAAQIAVLKTIKNYNLERVISFHNNINRAKNFVTDFSKILELIEENNRPSGKFWIEHVDGTMSAGKRREFINNLKSLEGFDVGLLTNARCLSEGVDVPSLDGVAFIDPKGSQVDIIQAVGRAIRKTENKKIGTIILPVFLEKGDSAETIIEASNFKPVWDVLKALRAHDEILADKLDKYRTETGLQVVKKLDGIGKIIFDLPTNVGKKFSESLFVRTVEQTTEDWKLYLGQLKRYKNQYGDLDVPQSFSFENGNLGGWVSGVRQGKSALTEKRLAELNELGFIWNSVQFKWDKAIGYLKLYVEEHGHADVPFPYTIDGFKLGQWVNARRSNLKEITTEEQHADLKKLGFIWDALEYRWDQNLKEYKNLIKSDRRYLLRVSEVGKRSERLINWVRQQRTDFQKGKISLDRIAKLNEIEFIWSEIDFQFDTDVAEIKNFYNKNGNFRFPEHLLSPYGPKLKGRFDFYRSQYKKGKLNIDWLKKLQKEIPNIFDEPEDWSTVFEKAKLELKKSSTLNHLKVSDKFLYKKLKNWIARQKEADKKGKLDPKRKEKLFTIGIFEDKEKNIIKILHELHSQNLLKDVDKTRTYLVDEINISQWIRTQRKKHREGRLNGEIYDLFSQLNIPLNPLEERWAKNIKLLKQYISVHKDTLIPHNHIEQGFALGVWAAARRQNKDLMTAAQISELNSLGFVWNHLEHDWDSSFSELKLFYKKKGSFRVPGDYKAKNGKKLSIWVNKQRDNYRKGKLSKRRIEKLKDIGFKFD